MPGRAPREKGNRYERGCVRTLQDIGIAAERVPLSGSAGGSFTGDLTVPVQGADRRVECKKRGTGFTSLYRWIDGNYALFVAQDRSETLVVMRLDDWAKLALIKPIDGPSP